MLSKSMFTCSCSYDSLLTEITCYIILVGAFCGIGTLSSFRKGG
jgi:hypothetical protein